MINNEILDQAFLTNLEKDIFKSKFFLNSWIPGSHLEKDKLLKFIENLYYKDLEQDPLAKKMEFILIHNLKNKNIYILEIDKFLSLDEPERLKWYANFTDFYLPRTIWYRSFCLLQKNLPEKFKNFI